MGLGVLWRRFDELFERKRGSDEVGQPGICDGDGVAAMGVEDLGELVVLVGGKGV